MNQASKMLSVMTTDHSFEMTEQNQAYFKLIGVAEQLGASVIRSHGPEHPFGWSEGVIRVDSQSRHAFDLAHEIGHLMASSPDRRNFPEYGLGAGFSSHKNVRKAASYHVVMLEELCACLLAAFLLDYVGLPNLGESQLVSLVGLNKRWDQTNVAEITDCLMLMQEWGLIDEDLNLTFCLREETHDRTSKETNELRAAVKQQMKEAA